MDSQATTVNDALRSQLNLLTGQDAPLPQGGPPPMSQPESAQAQPESRPESQPESQQTVQAAPPVAEPAKPLASDPRMQKVIAQAQQVRAEREAFKKSQDQHAADLRELEQYRALKARSKDDPVAIAETFGYKPDEYAAALIEKGAMTPERRKLFEQEQEIRDLKQWRQDFQQSQQKQTEQQNYNQVMREMEAFATHAGETFDLVRRTGNYNLVLEKINTHYQQTAAMGDAELLPYEQAFEMAEQELFDKVYAPVLDSPKIKAKYGVGSSVPAPQSAPQAAPAVRTSSGTITPRMRAQSAPQPEMSEAQKLEAAGRLLFKGFGSGGR